MRSQTTTTTVPGSLDSNIATHDKHPSFLISRTSRVAAIFICLFSNLLCTNIRHRHRHSPTRSFDVAWLTDWRRSFSHTCGIIKPNIYYELIFCGTIFSRLTICKTWKEILLLSCSQGREERMMELQLRANPISWRGFWNKLLSR